MGMEPVTPITITMAIRVKASRKRSSGCAMRTRWSLAASAWAFKTWFCHLAEVEDLVQLLLADAFSPRQLPDRLTAPHRFLGQLRGFVVADHRVERGGEHGAPLDQLGATVGRLEAFDAALGEIPSGGGEERDRFQRRHAGHGHHHVELEKASGLP